MVKLPFRAIALTTLGILVAAGTYPEYAKAYVAYAQYCILWTRTTFGKYGDWIDFLTVYGTIFFVVLILVSLWISVTDAMKKVH